MGSPLPHCAESGWGVQVTLKFHEGDFSPTITLGSMTMATRIKVWEINNGKIASAKEPAFADSHREDELEEWIVKSPDILGEKLLLIAKQLDIPNGRLDLLAIDANGRLVIIELKRALAPREAVAQGLDYASWLDSVSEEEILARANQYLRNASGDPDRTLSLAFEDTFGRKLPDWACKNHRLLIVAAGLDDSAERIVKYLAEKKIDINAVFFNYCELSNGTQILVRSVLVPESTMPTKAGGEPDYTEAVLLALAAERKVSELLKVCRRMRDVWQEFAEGTAQGSFRYWTGERMVMVYGINVSGKLANPPEGELDISGCDPRS
jgi:hypothetical protein